MSDPKYGEPIEEPTPVETASVDEAVASAHEGLADAEAASRVAAPDAVDVPETTTDAGAAAPAPEQHVVSTDPSATVAMPATHTQPTYGSSFADDPVDEAYVPGAYSDTSAETVVVTEQPVAPVAPVVAPAPAPQPIFVQAPEPPRQRGNRGAAGAIGLLATVAFGVLYLAAALGLRAINGEVTGANVGTAALDAVKSWWLWVPVAVFFIGFWLLGAIINRGRWGHWVIFGLLVGVVAYGGHLLGQLFQAPFWTLTAGQAADLLRGQLFAPLAIVAFVLGRELTIWFGAWVAARGRRVTELNDEAQREYERTLEAGPRLHQS